MATNNSLSENNRSGKPICNLCGAEMEKTVISSGNCSGIVLALIAFSIGLGIAIFLPVIGWILGAIICIFALFMGGKRQKVLKFSKCNSIVNCV